MKILTGVVDEYHLGLLQEATRFEDNDTLSRSQKISWSAIYWFPDIYHVTMFAPEGKTISEEIKKILPHNTNRS